MKVQNLDHNTPVFWKKASINILNGIVGLSVWRHWDGERERRVHLIYLISMWLLEGEGGENNKANGQLVLVPGTYKIGRGTDVDIRCEDVSISRHHATIVVSTPADTTQPSSCTITGRSAEPQWLIWSSLFQIETWDIGLWYRQSDYGQSTSMFWLWFHERKVAPWEIWPKDERYQLGCVSPDAHVNASRPSIFCVSGKFKWLEERKIYMGCSQPIMLIIVRQKVLFHLMSEYTMTERCKSRARN